MRFLFSSVERERMVGRSGLEPPTSRLSGGCSNQLSYEPITINGGDKRIRTADPLLARQVLYQLSYTPTIKLKRYSYVPSKLNNDAPFGLLT